VIASGRGRLIPLLEVAVVLLLIGTLTASYFLVTGEGAAEGEGLLPPWIVASLLVANLVPAMALMVLVARRIARRRAARMGIGGKGRLHVRLVAFFSVIASIPTVLVVIFASFLLQSGMNFWFSGQAQGMFDNGQRVTRNTEASS
jgi:two-component system nitrogen regulation sensor histidine kinase NtrY